MSHGLLQHAAYCLLFPIDSVAEVLIQEGEVEVHDVQGPCIFPIQPAAVRTENKDVHSLITWYFIDQVVKD
jgi:hypothetical protein